MLLYYHVLVAQSCPTLCNPIDCSPPGSSAHEIFQARILESFAISFSRGSSQPRDQTQISCTAGRFFNDWATREALYITILSLNGNFWSHANLINSKYITTKYFLESLWYLINLWISSQKFLFLTFFFY